MKALKIINIQFFDQSHDALDEITGELIYELEYSANIALESEGKQFMVQFSGDEVSSHASLPASDTACYNGAEAQDWACENFELRELVAFIEGDGVENNFFWLDENADERY